MEPNATSVGIEPKKSNGALVGSIIIILILVLGAVYILSRSRVEAPVVPESLSQSDDISSIEADLSAQGNIDNLDQGI